ncbi:phage major capsid protein [Dehalobacter sp. DCM]|uniref:phage major capsid protein n=1 Tax=Dehalobacter sp. DCM TaxID=2907827 RepID=UPI0030815749|nr:phage major capsid protein [Dehalobacter sp. DCM]
MKNLKALIEKRAELQTEMDSYVTKADTEQRAMTAEEITKFDAAEQAIKDIDATIAREERARATEKKEFKEEKTEERAEVLEERAFANFIRKECGMPVEVRSGEQNFTIANNGAVIPTSIVNRVISTVKEMSPIFARATMFSVKGTLKVPVYGLANTTHDITVGYQDEFTDITADAGAFTSVDLSGFLAGALTLIGKSVINNSDIDVVSFIIKEMGTKIALFLEDELLNGTTDKAEGALSTTNTMNAGSISAITADNLIDLQAKIPTVHQANACWTMAPATFTAIRKLKYGDGKYLIQDSFTGQTPFTLLGKPVYLSDNMPAIGSAAKAVLYGDYSGLAVNMRQNIEMQILNEKYATMHAVGIVSWFEFDSDVIDNQKLATLVMSV